MNEQTCFRSCPLARVRDAHPVSIATFLLVHPHYQLTTLPMFVFWLGCWCSDMLETLLCPLICRGFPTAEHLESETEVDWEQLVARQTVAQWFPFREKVQEKKKEGGVRVEREGDVAAAETQLQRDDKDWERDRWKEWPRRKTWGLRPETLRKTEDE